nr:hypothetical protein [Bacteroidota bacterium]
MRKTVTLFMVCMMALTLGIAQENTSPIPEVASPTYFDVSPPLRDIPIVPPFNANKTKRNEELKNRAYPFAETALPKGPDPAWQKEMGLQDVARELGVDIAGISNINSTIPPDTQGDIGPDHYFQVVNVSFQIWDNSGTSLYGPANITTIWSGISISSSVSDPIVLYDEQADRWFVSIFKTTSPYEIYVAVSTTGDPTGTWNRYEYSWTTKPDYAKYGVWRDGYYMGANTGGSDVAVFERSDMIAGNASPSVVKFDNPNRPGVGFHAIQPLDNDGTWSPSGSPGLFITMNDDAWGGSDQLWIYELDVNWTFTWLSTFSRVQTINVSSFDSNFGPNWDNIKQPGTTQELDAIPEVLMYRAQYRNFGTHQTIVCCHNVDVD